MTGIREQEKSPGMPTAASKHQAPTIFFESGAPPIHSMNLGTRGAVDALASC